MLKIPRKTGGFYVFINKNYMNKYLDFRTLVIATLALLLLLMWFKNDKPTDNKTIKIDGKRYEVIKEVHDTVIVTKTNTILKKGKDIPLIVIKTEYLPTKIDSNEILKEYYYTKIYNDTLKMGGNNFAYISDTISRNSLLSRKFTYKIEEKTINNTIYLKEPEKTQFYWGLEGNTSTDLSYQSFGGSIMMKSKNNKIIKLNIGVLNNNGVSPYYGIGFYKKIGK